MRTFISNDSLHIKIFPSEEVPLVPVPGIWVQSSDIIPPSVANPENAANFLNNIKIDPISKDSTTRAIIPVLPAITATIKHVDRPILTQAPLKHSDSPYTNTHYKGIRSGQRSSIIRCTDSPPPNSWIIAYGPNCNYSPDPQGNTYLRLKGCGMWTSSTPLPFPGITLEDTNSRYFKESTETPVKLVDIRGYSYPITSSTELYMSQKLTSIFNKLGLLFGNEPLGFWNYANLLNDPTPLIQKSVAIFRTYGDLRLEHHLFSGLELFLQTKLPEEIATKSLSLISTLYSSCSICAPSNNNKTYQRIDLLNFSNYENFIIDHQNDFSSGTIQGLMPNDLISCGFISPDKLYSVIKDIMITDRISLIQFMKLYGRIGWEVGRILSIIHRCGISWGTYVDHCDEKLHFNSHGDNMYIIPKEYSQRRNDGKYQILAPIDFDMAFDRDMALNTYKNPPMPDKKYCQFTTEIQFMLNAIDGLLQLGIFSCMIFKRDQLNQPYNDLIWCCRDVCTWEFFNGIMCPLEELKDNDLTLEQAYEIIEPALDITKNISA
ncbi:Adenylyltransferase and sulfurtransferase MOCS3 [Histomonas meleagridis]|uniref:Adenylyltransferase and sulfurtransferase MOCS3 n=1 Tax=Histomonas meleagridis TaxID=135588 RepID=UPI003559DA04|nr:Adenylyltransferase and sulfurtransferase MOCS3 [Histomonas meleagridis]KAH0796977.1 Adenylyltransferase and sulfurtransferase MOCS3 [Histomonas meleagridis]